MADALLQREALDGDQVRRIVAGLPLDALAPPAPEPPAPAVADPRGRKEFNPIVPPIPQRPLTQE
jgi:hypothetical protein